MIVPDQAVVVVGGGRQAKEVLEDYLNPGEVEQILAPDYMGYPLIGVVEGRGEEIRNDILTLPRQDHITDLALSGDRVDTVQASMRGARIDEGKRPLGREPPNPIPPPRGGREVPGG